MKSSIFLFIAGILFLTLAGCEDNGNNTKVNGTGPIVSEELSFSAFDKINLTGVANFYITIGSPQSVVLKAQQNIIDVLTYEVINQTLTVGVKKNVSIENHEEIRFDIAIPSISMIDLEGVGDFLLSGSPQDQLTIVLVGVGNVEAFDMKVGDCTITSTGVGNCEVDVINNLNVTISGIGSIYYKGSPTINSTIEGVGQLIDSN